MYLTREILVAVNLRPLEVYRYLEARSEFPRGKGAGGRGSAGFLYLAYQAASAR